MTQGKAVGYNRHTGQPEGGTTPEPEDIVQALMAALEARGVPEGVVIADLMRLEQHLSDSLRIVRAIIDAVVRGARSGL